MSSPDRAEARRILVEELHVASPQAVLVVTGGGFGSITDLLHVSGASATVLEVTVPYAESSLADLLDASPERAVSSETASAMAAAAHHRARNLRADHDVVVFGVSCTAALVTNRPKRGDHRAHVSFVGDDAHQGWSLTLAKGARDRAGEDRVVADLVLVALAGAFGVETTFDLDLLPADELLG